MKKFIFTNHDSINAFCSKLVNASADKKTNFDSMEIQHRDGLAQFLYDEIISRFGVKESKSRCKIFCWDSELKKFVEGLNSNHEIHFIYDGYKLFNDDFEHYKNFLNESIKKFLDATNQEVNIIHHQSPFKVNKECKSYFEEYLFKTNANIVSSAHELNWEQKESEYYKVFMRVYKESRREGSLDPMDELEDALSKIYSYEPEDTEEYRTQITQLRNNLLQDYE